MTSYRNGETRAHVMEWAHARHQWEPLCGRDSLNVTPEAYRGAADEDWPLRYVGHHERLVPWCAQCVKAVQRRVDESERDVLVPAAEQAVA